MSVGGNGVTAAFVASDRRFTAAPRVIFAPIYQLVRVSGVSGASEAPLTPEHAAADFLAGGQL